MKIGVQMYTIRDYLKTPNEIESSIKRIKEMGFDLVQISGLGPIDTDKLAKLFKDNGIEACGTHSPWESVAEPKELDKLIEEHKKTGMFANRHRHETRYISRHIRGLYRLYKKSK